MLAHWTTRFESRLVNRIPFHHLPPPITSDHPRSISSRTRKRVRISLRGGPKFPGGSRGTVNASPLRNERLFIWPAIMSVSRTTATKTGFHPEWVKSKDDTRGRTGSMAVALKIHRGQRRHDSIARSTSRDNSPLSPELSLICSLVSSLAPFAVTDRRLRDPRVFLEHRLSEPGSFLGYLFLVALVKGLKY